MCTCNILLVRLRWKVGELDERTRNASKEAHLFNNLQVAFNALFMGPRAQAVYVCACVCVCVSVCVCVCVHVYKNKS